MSDRNQLNDNIICDERLSRLGNLALDVVETLLTDTETPIETRLSAAFRIFELCGTVRQNNNDKFGQAVVNGIEKNAAELTQLETLLKGKLSLQS